LGILACERQPASALGWVRRGTIFLDVETRATARITVEPAHGPADYAYLFGPDGRTLARRRLEPGYRGTLELPLDRPGLYTLVPSPSHRTRVEAHGARLVLEPAREFPTFFQASDGEPLAFEVPAGTPALEIAATNQFDWSGSAGEIRVFTPDGSLAHVFSFEDLDEERILTKLGVPAEKIAHYRAQGDTAEVPEFRLLVDRWRCEAPVAGAWRIEASIAGPKSDDLGLWLDGIPNVLFPVGSRPVALEHPAARARVHVDPARVLGPVGDVGAVWGWTVYREESLAAFREMGLTNSVHFFPQVDMERENDDGDANHLAADRFLFAPFVDRMDVYRDRLVPLTELMVISRIAPWAQKSLPEIAEFAEACVRYHVVDAGLSPEGLYWQFLNEPNHDVSAGEYVEAFRAVGARLRETLEAKGVPVRLGGPGTGNAWKERDEVPWEWISKLIEEADPELDFIVWNQYRLGRIEDTWRFRANIETIDSLSAALDSDGTREELVIGATNLAGGVVLETEKQDGWYSAVWWPSVLCQTLGTGRCRIVSYFFLIDQGARRKGLVREDWSRKPVALATAFATAHLGTDVIAAHSDHDGLDVLFTRDGSSPEIHALLVNKMPRELEVTLPLPVVRAELFDPVTGRIEASTTAADTITLPARALAGVLLEAPR